MYRFLLKTIIGHYTVFHGLIPIFRWLQYIYQNKNKIIYKVRRHVQSKIQAYCLNKRFNMSYHFTI